ncbi:hypothetical protein [Salinivibrio sp. PR919]|uniref:hypothetical protein n=1 Tax=Salinivibrio sp. PR919 TaxID=1909491 RepID=UPI0009876136|nr:hypothetical protein [Salinivibrio sp. PR919]OOF10887.1 hypothetical protein BZG83_13220 [Salinivibrio sp. PR919]
MKIASMAAIVTCLGSRAKAANIIKDLTGYAISPSTIGRIERGECKPAIDHLTRYVLTRHITDNEKERTMTNAISEAKTFDEVIEIINASANGEASPYFGGTDLREPHDMAGQYAFEAAEESGYLDDDSISAHLDLLQESGARFDYQDALKVALSYKYK